MTKAKANSKERDGVVITGLGNVEVRRDRDATRVRVPRPSVASVLSNLLDLSSQGILLEQDESGYLLHRGGQIDNQVRITRNGQTPVIFEVGKALQKKRNKVIINEVVR